MVVIFLDELKDEAAVKAVIPKLTNQVIEATTAIRNKRRKIANVEVQVRMVQKLCAVNRWLKCQLEIDGMLSSLENARAEDTVNLWQL
tara:strand:+ start:250 stop:513 length:264 start_codon:yes stop_codon:yes gene_type:complete